MEIKTYNMAKMLIDSIEATDQMLKLFDNYKESPIKVLQNALNNKAIPKDEIEEMAEVMIEQWVKLLEDNLKSDKQSFEKLKC